MTQEEALSILKTGANVFLTGEPGSGKTHTVNRYVEYLREHGIEPAVTASTGIAATHIGGMTIHSWSGIGIRKTLSEEDLDALCQVERLVSRVSRVSVLIIDEISMLDARTLSAVDAACRALRRREEPFGGIQVLFVGDFFQLPPVARDGEAPSEFAYLSPAWKEANPIISYLSEQHRHEDQNFLAFLSAVRCGAVTRENHSSLLARKIEVKETESMTRLYSHNVDVDRVNHAKLLALQGENHTFEMQSRGSGTLVAQLKRGCLSPEILSLKIGAQVMFTKNSFEGAFVNGTLGEVVGFAAEGAPIIRTKKGRQIEVVPMEWVVTDGTRTLAKIIQLPLRLAWAITVHKSQGMTLDVAVIDLREAFEYGQGYVALSRVRAFSGIFLLGYNERSLQVHPAILSSDAGFRNNSREAHETFLRIPSDERDAMEKNFIIACGGKVEKVGVKSKSSRARALRQRGKTTYDETLEFLKKGKSIEEVALARGVTRGTIIAHLEELYMGGKVDVPGLARLVRVELHEKMPKIHSVFRELGTEKLAPIFQKLDGEYSYDDLRLARLLMHAKQE